MKTKSTIFTVLLVGLLFSLLFSCKEIVDIISQSQTPATVTDIDGNVYHTVTIGTQVWMTENLKVTHYRNGDLIPNVTVAKEWKNLITGAYCDQHNDANTSMTYGRLYNWHAVNDLRNIAPKGWHVPSDAEWRTLMLFLDLNARFPTDDNGIESYTAGGELKETGTTHWLTPNTGATNKTGFTALPGGFRDDLGAFTHFSTFGMWWSSSGIDTRFAWARFIRWDNSNVYANNSAYKTFGQSVRCVRN